MQAFIDHIMMAEKIRALEYNLLYQHHHHHCKRKSVFLEYFRRRTVTVCDHTDDMDEYYDDNQYDAYQFESPTLSARNLINLLRKMKYPYYVDKSIIVLFTEKDAFMAKLAGAQGWLDGK